MNHQTLNPTCVAIAVALADNGGAIDDVIRLELDSIDFSRATKADPVAELIKFELAEQGRHKADADAANAKAKVAQRCVDSLKAYLKERMIASGTDELRGLRYVVRVQDSPLSVKWEGEGDPPAPFQRIKIEPNIDAVKVFYEQGHPLPPGFTASRGRHLVITS